MSLGTFVAGRFSATWDADRTGTGSAVDMGLMEEGYEVSWRYGEEPVNQSDAYGQMYIEGIYQGIVDCFIQGTALEWKAGVVTAATAWNTMAVSGGTTLSPGVIGRLATDVAGTIILSSTAATPAASSPATLTATYAMISTELIRFLLHSKLRKVPLRFRVFPYLNSTIQFLTAT